MYVAGVALRNAVLAALLDGPASGYDLAKDFHASVANFWAASPQQLYRELDRMATEGLISARLVEQDRRPNKHLYSLTAAGRRQLREFTRAAAKPSVIRDELLIQVRAIDVGDGPAVRRAIDDRSQAAAEKLARYRDLQADLLDGRSEDDYLAGADRVGPYLTLLRGIEFEQENIRWAQRALSVLDAREAR